MNWEELLNNEQLSGVKCDSQYTKVIAGAGSGKTRVLTYRIAYLMLEKNVNVSEILGITFTNKAANEIKQRVINLIPYAYSMSLSTIHSWCARFLRTHFEEINYPRNFTILDDDDQLQVMKKVFVNDGRDKKDKQIKECLNWILKKKMEGFQYKDLEGTKYPNPQYNLFLIYFRKYTEILSQTASLDFDDLLLKTIEILRKNHSIRKIYQERYKHILVDEFQDINDVQFDLIRLLMGKDTSLYVVGDPDQTIYTWRGANHKIMIDLENNIRVDYKNAVVNTIILKNNYRSSATILKCANKLIDNNQERIKKDLFAINDEGEKITFFNARTSSEEASFVVNAIKELVKDKNKKYSDFAILYRSNYLTRELEAHLNLHQVPYKLFGGQKFYQRREIKDILAYLYLIVNPLDDISLERIINVPKRNIGPTSVEQIKQKASDASQSIYLFLKENINLLNLPETKLNEIKKLINIIENTKSLLSSVKQIEYGTVIEKMVEDLKYFYFLDNEDNADERKENIQELIGTIKAFFNNNPNADFADFITNATLQASSDEIENGDYVSLMTVHTAKGLEFDTVFIYGLNEGVFPSNRAIQESSKNIEEERRLAYVAFTRAKKKLYLTCNQDFSYVTNYKLTPSRFLKEAGVQIKKEQEIDKTITKNYYNPYSNSSYSNQKKVQTPTSNGISKWEVGEMLEHEQFGVGIVTKNISDKLIEVKFNNGEVKTLLGSHYKIKKVVS